MCVLHLDVLLLFSQQNDWNVPVFWLVMASRKREPHSKPCWQCRVCTCIALPDSRNPCCLLEVKSKIISGHCQCGQSFLFLCAAVQDLCSFQKKNSMSEVMRGFALANVGSRDYVSRCCSIPERKEGWKSFFIKQSLNVLSRMLQKGKYAGDLVIYT